MGSNDTSPTIRKLLPWGWTIAPLESNNATCPTVPEVLGTFAVVNAVVSVFALIFGHRKVIKFITCKHWGDKGSKAWVWTWIFPLGLQLAANAIIALIIKKTPGYTSDFHVWELMLFLVARPRLSWIVLTFVGTMKFRSKEQRQAAEYRLVGNTSKVSQRTGPTPYNPSGSTLAVPSSTYGTADPNYAYQYPYNDPESTAYTSGYSSNANSQQNLVEPIHFTSDEPEQVDQPYHSTFMSQLIAELFLQFVALYIMGYTAHFAAGHGYYKLGKEYYSLPQAAHMMYAGALYYLVGGSLSLSIVFLSLMAVWRRGLSELRATARYGAGYYSGIAACILLLMTTWMASWIFWAGFVKLAGHLYCPPSLYNQAIIWIVFSLPGIFMGGAT
ncbi:hypothetical protein K402DRAFT_417453 [Aulographum hederae CBS 113979]|uniref:Uncharacterized protein n=1 Tax=Aulographum hederae CBS 113979 TaxID=1176131 RepID=A0A6G1HC89_9PEZI|nr:hypothetical protein K402DRAFT_417453 [Aulographum hederae CBS 113979]